MRPCRPWQAGRHPTPWSARLGRVRQPWQRAAFVDATAFSGFCLAAVLAAAPCRALRRRRRRDVCRRVALATASEQATAQLWQVSWPRALEPPCRDLLRWRHLGRPPEERDLRRRGLLRRGHHCFGLSVAARVLNVSRPFRAPPTIRGGHRTSTPRSRPGRLSWPPTVWPCPIAGAVPLPAGPEHSRAIPRSRSRSSPSGERTGPSPPRWPCTRAETEYVFNDGPPFANGLPHYGHLLTGFVKDAVPRYKTMRGRRVERRFGWDCHGLPAETEAEKELGVSGRGGDHRVRHRPLQRLLPHLGAALHRRLGALRHPPGALGRLRGRLQDDGPRPSWRASCGPSSSFNDKGLIYEGFRVLPYCWECETPLSNFETRHDDAYRDRIDPAVTVRFDLEPADGGPELLAGPGRAAGVDDDALDPAVEPRPRRRPRPRLRRARPATAPGSSSAPLASLPTRTSSPAPSVLGTVTGADLVGRRYRPLFPYFAGTPGAFVVLGGTSSPPTRAPASSTWRRASARTTSGSARRPASRSSAPVDDRARFTGEVAGLRRRPGLRGQRRRSSSGCASAGALLQVEDVHPQLPALLADRHAAHLPGRELVLRRGHCDQGPHGRAQPADQLGARARARRRLRQVAGGGAGLVDHAEPLLGHADPGLEERRPARTRASTSTAASTSSRPTSASRPTDLHRPAIDELVRPNPDDPTGSSMMRRVTDVLDCWFESGSMPFAQLHYPFENTKRFEEHFPADFIVEYVGQTRGWFYTLHVLATALFDRPPFKNCIAHGIVLGDDGRKLSKRLRNFPDPEEFFASTRRRRDALVPALLAGAARPRRRHRGAGDGRAGPAGAATRSGTRWYFLSPLRQRRRASSGTVRTDQTGVLDRYILAKTRRLVEDVDGRDRPLRPRRRDSRHRVVPRRAHQLVRAPQPRPLLASAARRRRRRCPGAGARPAADAETSTTPTTPCTPCSRCSAGSSRRFSRSSPRRSSGGSPASAACTSPSGPLRRRAARPTPTSSRRWTSSARSAPPATRSARPPACGPGSRFAA